MRPHLVEIPALAVVPAAPAGQVAAAPNTSVAPDYSVEDPARNWLYLQPATGPRVVLSASPKGVIQRVQKSINATGLKVREDGVLDQATLARAAEILPTKWHGVFADGGSLTQALLASERAAQLSPRAYTSLLVLGLDPAEASILATPQANFAWLARGGIALGTNAQLPSVRLPAVEKNNALERLAPAPVAFVRRHKTPILVGGGLLAVGLIGYGVWRYTREEI